MRILIGAVIGCAVLATTVAAQHQHGAPAAPRGRRPARLEVHASPGRRRGARQGSFADLECYQCHRVDGLGFPPTGGEGKTGPPLTGAGGQHPAEYFAESILSPNAVAFLKSLEGGHGSHGRPAPRRAR